MTIRTRTGLLLLVLAAGLPGCDGGRPSVPSGPSTLPPPQTPSPGNSAFSVADVTLSGVVSEVTPNGLVPLEGVGVSNGEGEYAVTDANGFFSIRPVWVCPCSAQPWIEAGTTLLWLYQDGYDDPAGQPPSLFARGLVNPGPGWRDVTIDGDTRFDTQLVRRSR